MKELQWYGWYCPFKEMPMSVTVSCLLTLNPSFSAIHMTLEHLFFFNGQDGNGCQRRVLVGQKDKVLVGEVLFLPVLADFTVTWKLVRCTISLWATLQQPLCLIVSERILKAASTCGQLFPSLPFVAFQSHSYEASQKFSAIQWPST